MSAEPAFRINGAEMFLDSDTKEKNSKIQNIRFLTNQRNMRPENLTSENFLIPIGSPSLPIDSGVDFPREDFTLGHFGFAMFRLSIKSTLIEDF